jgi:RNA polymerase sigma factor (TIGR02999 family)
MHDPADITVLLRAARRDAAAEERLYALIYDELRGLARNQLRAERSDHTLQATALANEVYLKLLGQAKDDWQNRAQFFALAARAARRVLVDHARSRLRAKRGGGARHTSLGTDIDPPAPETDDRLVALDDALTRLKLDDPVKGQIVEMRHFAGFTNREIAQALEVSTRTVERHWRVAKAWLYRALSEDQQGE